MKARSARVLRTSQEGLLAEEDLEGLRQALARGGCSILPTDTGYMMAVDALSEGAIARLFAIKGRPEANPVHVAVANLAMAEELAEISETARKLAAAFLPGPLTIVCPKRSIVPDALVAHSGTIGFRIPDSPVVLQACAALGRPLTATSANRSGKAPLWEIEEIQAEMGEEIDFLVEAHGFASRIPSTVVKVVGDEVTILRPGPIGAREIEKVVQGSP